jgi:spore germination protein KC
MKLKLAIYSIVSIILLTGCWDQQLLKDVRLVYGSSFDLEDDDSILTTSVIRSLKQTSRGTADIEAVNVILNAKGNTLRETRVKLDRELAGEYGANKTRVFVFGETLAKTDIYPILDILYRDPRSSLGAKPIIAKGRGEEILKLNKVEEILISEYLLELISSAEKNTLVSRETVQSICPVLFDPGQDFFLPVIRKTEEGVIMVEGVGLFNGRTYTGIDLTGDDSTILLLLNNQKNKFAKFTVEVNPEAENKRERFISVEVVDLEHSLNIDVSNSNNIEVDIQLALKLKVTEFPKDNLSDPKEIEKLNNKMSQYFTEKAIGVIKTLQEADCDALGVGRDLIAFHPKTWKKIDWKEKYPSIQINTLVDTKIIEKGIIN